MDSSRMILHFQVQITLKSLSSALPAKKERGAQSKHLRFIFIIMTFANKDDKRNNANDIDHDSD